MKTLTQLELEARAAVDAVKDDPERRYQMRERFYARFGKIGSPGIGRSELDFMRWEIERGVLKPVALGGSAWWRAVNEQILFDGELATRIEDELPSCDPGFLSVRHWLTFMRSSTRSDWAWQWYRAHNASIVTGYVGQRALARQEAHREKVFLNMVLYRVLYAQALVEGDTIFGPLGKILANPVMPSVEALLDVPGFYPKHYPMTDAEWKDVIGKGHSLPADVLDLALDDFLILPGLDTLYMHASGWLGMPSLNLLLSAGTPAYPTGQRRKVEPESPHPKLGPGPKRKVAILGGGLASLSAAYELTSYADWKDRYEITLYQLGWRIGGKTASGWGPGGRIEERGIHIFQGWYNNAFRMVQDAYSVMQANGLNEKSPLQYWDEAFIPDDATLFTQFDTKKKAWTNWPVLFPYNDEIPGKAGSPPPAFEVIGEALGLFTELVLGSPFQEPKDGCLPALLGHTVARAFFTPPWEAVRPKWWKHLRSAAVSAQPSYQEREHVQWLLHARDLISNAARTPTTRLAGVEVSVFRAVVELFTVFVEFLRFIDRETGERDEKLDHIVVLAEYGLANLRGILADVYDEKTHTFDFSRINDYDYREWLLRHGLPNDLSDCAPVRFIYCGAFHNQYQGGPGRLAADMAVRSLLVSVTYRGQLVWRLVGGTGGSLMAPLYKMLAHRGVKFEFFHDVEEIAWSATGEIERVEVGVQVNLGPGRASYDPLEPVDGLDAFPAAPKYGELDPAQAKKLIEEKIDLESPWSGWKPVGHKTLKKGVDFDDVINGIPVRATERICAGLVKNTPQWTHLAKVRSTPTFGVQLWLRPTLDELGMDLPSWGMESGDYPNSVIYADLFYSWTDTSCVVALEGWKADRTPGEISYYCGTWPMEMKPFSDHGFPEKERQRLVDYTKKWIGQNMGWFFPNATKGDQFDLRLMVDPSDPTNAKDLPGDTRFAAQWFVVNMAPSDEYTLAWPGSDKYRLKPGDTGFSNLYVCGDWTNFGLNIGHVEGAVTSGLVAAQALLARHPHGTLRVIFRDIAEGSAS